MPYELRVDFEPFTIGDGWGWASCAPFMQLHTHICMCACACMHMCDVHVHVHRTTHVHVHVHAIFQINNTAVRLCDRRALCLCPLRLPCHDGTSASGVGGRDARRPGEAAGGAAGPALVDLSNLKIKFTHTHPTHAHHSTPHNCTRDTKPHGHTNDTTTTRPDYSSSHGE